jgi:hypothetical protein
VKRLAIILQAVTLTAFILAILSGGCSKVDPELPETTPIEGTFPLTWGRVDWFIDAKNGNVCYVLKPGAHGAGISCVPLEAQ